ncbi:MAG TPA: cell division protein FtsK, partial [Deltaproteobacteria bacterium]|nr:cell division protein FtsK [Deltaproteobacteria bacterium]
MAKKSPEKAANPPSRGYLHEILGVITLSLGAFILLCLYSYSPLDPSFNSAAGGAKVHNYGGLVGSYLADLLISGFGVGSFLIASFLLIASYLCFTKKRERITWPGALLLLIALAMASVLFQLHWKTVTIFGHATLAGGMLGALLGEQLRRYLSEVGSYFLVISVGILAFIWGTKISLVEIVRVLKNGVKSLAAKLFSLAIIYRARWEKYREKRREEAERLRKEKETKVIPAAKPKINLPRRPEEDSRAEAKAALPLSPSPAPRAVLTSLPSAGSEGEPKIFQRQNAKSEARKDEQLPIQKLSGNFELPPLALLDPVPESASRQTVDEESLKASSLLLESKLRDYGVEGRVTEIHPGPVVTMYEFEPAAGVKVNKVTNLVDDLSLSMGGRPVRIVAPLPGKPAIGIEIPNHERETVYYKEIVADARFQKAESKLTLALGKNIEGVPVVADLGKMPHLLVAGATGAGKSVGLNSFILSLLLRNTPEDVRFIFIDPKMLELSVYSNIPHLLLPVVTQPKKAALALRWAVSEMERRYRLLSDGQVRNITGYNKKFEKGGFKDHPPPPQASGDDADPIRHDSKLPYIVIIIDELADLMMVAGREVEEYITRLAQMARAAGIHMILATQRPSVDVITGIIKANFPSRIAFKVTSKHDSRTILDTIGAEHLLGNGDMLFIPPGLAKQTRVHGAFVSDQEVLRIVEHLKEQGRPVYNEEIMNMKDSTEAGPGGLEEESDELYDQAVSVVTETGQASISMVQRRLRIGYNRAAR